MIDFFKYFFRGVEDGTTFPFFGVGHLLLLFIFLGGIIFIVKNDLSKKTWDRLLKTAVLFLLVDQMIIYHWQILSGYFRLDISLPLYHCRIAVWLLIIAVVFKNRIAKIIGIYWGFFGSFGAILVPDPYKFKFPHYTMVNYFLVHIIMGWLVTYFICVEKFHITKEDNKRAFLWINLYNFFLYGINRMLVNRYPNVNYGYMMKMPDSFPQFPRGIVQALLMMLVFNILIYASYMFFYYLQNKIEQMKKISY